MNAGECPRSLCLCFSQNKINVQQKKKNVKGLQRRHSWQRARTFSSVNFLSGNISPNTKTQ